MLKEKIKLSDLKGKQFKAVKELYFSEQDKQNLQGLFIKRINGEQYCNEYELHNNIKVNTLEENDYLFNREFICDNLQIYLMQGCVTEATDYFNKYGKVTDTEYIEKINRVKMTIKNFKMNIKQEVDKELDNVTLDIKDTLRYIITDNRGRKIHGNPIKASEIVYNNGLIEIHKSTHMNTTIKYTLILE